MSLGDTVCLISLPYLVLCGYLSYQLDKAAGSIVENSMLHEEDEEQLLWMINAMALPIFLLSPILYLFGIQDQIIHWLVWGKLEARNFKNELTKGG